MPNTLAEVEVKKATATNTSSTRKAVPDYEEQRHFSKWLWLFAPLTLLIAGSASFLAVRRWLNNRDEAR
jgi:predicted lysophospholipase L1 biosynthesis ABC-type transport system permease subunit